MPGTDGWEGDAMAFALAGIIGWPAEHSRSPVLHGHWLRVHGIDGAFVKLHESTFLKLTDFSPKV